MSRNLAIIVGHVGKEPEYKKLNGSSVCNFSVATNETWKDKSGMKQENTEWHNIVCWNNLADFLGENLKQGASVYVEGQLQTKEWEGESGVKMRRTEIKARSVQLLSPKKTGNDAEFDFDSI